MGKATRKRRTKALKKWLHSYLGWVWMHRGEEAYTYKENITTHRYITRSEREWYANQDKWWEGKL